MCVTPVRGLSGFRYFRGGPRQLLAGSFAFSFVLLKSLA